MEKEQSIFEANYFKLQFPSKNSKRNSKSLGCYGNRERKTSNEQEEQESE